MPEITVFLLFFSEPTSSESFELPHSLLHFLYQKNDADSAIIFLQSLNLLLLPQYPQSISFYDLHSQLMKLALIDSSFRVPEYDFLFPLPVLQ